MHPGLGAFSINVPTGLAATMLHYIACSSRSLKESWPISATSKTRYQPVCKLLARSIDTMYPRFLALGQPQPENTLWDGFVPAIGPNGPKPKSFSKGAVSQPAPRIGANPTLRAANAVAYGWSWAYFIDLAAAWTARVRIDSASR